MNHKDRLRVARTTIRTLDVADMAVQGGTRTRYSCGVTEDTGQYCNGSAAKDCSPNVTREMTR